MKNNPGNLTYQRFAAGFPCQKKEIVFEGRLFVGHFCCLYRDVSSPGQRIAASGICCLQ